VRALIVGGGCRGRTLAQRLIGDGHAVRIVTRSPERHAVIEEIGAEPWAGDPDRVGTLRYALDNVTVVLWLLGTATGPAGDVAALHGSRLEMMLERSVDTTVRGVVYEAAGTLPQDVYDAGVREVVRANQRNEVPYRVLAVDPADGESWQEGARGAIFSLLEPRSME
jgi:hypothetical protein